MTTLFIKRPVLAITLNAFVLIFGLVAYQSLTLSEYPEISVPKIKVGVVYPGASMSDIESSIAFQLEDELAGIQHVDSVRSEIGNGYCETWISFRSGAQIEQALVEVRDRVARLKSTWPREVLEPFVEREGKDQNITIYLNLFSAERSAEELTHFAKLHILNQLQSIQGVSSIRIMGVPYVMEVQLEPLKMAGYEVSSSQVAQALRDHRASLAVGRYHGEIPMTLRFSLEEPIDFESVVIKKLGDFVVRLSDVAQVKLSYDTRVLNRLNGEEAVFLGLAKTSDGNPLSISKQVKALLPSLQASLPKDVQISMNYDGAEFIKSSIKSLATSILEACLLVLLVVFLFLRNWRATLIPMIAIPISLVGALAIIKLLGFSINTFSLLALVLAVGLVVDDAIIVVENIHRHMEKGLSAFQAAIEGSREIAFSIIVMTLTLSAVFIPIALIGGMIGQILIEFAVTLAAAVLVSGLVALTLSPLMCAKMLKTPPPHSGGGRFWFTKIGRGPHVLGALGVIIVSTALLYNHLPKRVLPLEDRGFMGVQVEPLEGAKLDKLTPYLDQVDALALQNPDIENRFLYANDRWGTGISFMLKDYSKRSKSAQQIVDDVREQLKKIPSIITYVWSWDTGLPGFEQDEQGAGISVAIQTTHSYQDLSNELLKLQKSLAKNDVLQDLRYDLQFNYPGYKVEVDTHQMALLEVNIRDVATAMQTLFDRSESLEFFKDGLRYKVLIRGEKPADSLHEVDVLSANGSRIPLSAFVEFKPTSEPKSLSHYNRMRSAQLMAQLAPGKTLADGIKTLKVELGKELPAGYSYAFLGAAKNWLDSSNTFLMMLLLALVFIYGILSIQFESFLDPLIILVTVPLAAFGALFGVWVMGQELDIFSQIGLVTLIGLIAKHGILLVDFANKTGSMKQAVSMRLRPILMTTGAMVLGAVPLLLASGAGSEARRSIGSVLVFGLLFGTALTIWVLPKIYEWIRRLHA